jgi:hypothetical protein
VAPPDELIMPTFTGAWSYSRKAPTIHSASSVGNDSLQMTVNRYSGMIARSPGDMARAGTGDRANLATMLTVRQAWDAEPDATSSW